MIEEMTAWEIIDSLPYTIEEIEMLLEIVERNEEKDK